MNHHTTSSRGARVTAAAFGILALALSPCVPAEGSGSNHSAGAFGLRPMLPVHAWSQRHHRLGLLSIDRTGNLVFSELTKEPSSEPDRPGYWIEEWKALDLQHLFPDMGKSFWFGETVEIAGEKYRRVQSRQDRDVAPGLSHLRYRPAVTVMLVAT